MNKLMMLCVLPFFVASHAEAATLGLTCAGRTEIIVAPNLEEAEQCAAVFPKVCVSGFSAVGGHYAVAETLDGRGLGAAGVLRLLAQLPSARWKAARGSTMVIVRLF